MILMLLYKRLMILRYANDAILLQLGDFICIVCTLTAAAQGICYAVVEPGLHQQHMHM
jgi:hypothetical protein